MGETKGEFQLFLILYAEFKKIESESGHKIIQDKENPYHFFILDSNENFLEKFSLEEYIKELQNDNTSTRKSGERDSYTQRVERESGRAIGRIRSTIEERSRRSRAMGEGSQSFGATSNRVGRIHTLTPRIRIHELTKLRQAEQKLTELERQKAIDTYKQMQQDTSIKQINEQNRDIQATEQGIQAESTTQTNDSAPLQTRLDRNLRNYSKSQEAKYLVRCNALVKEVKDKGITLDSKSLKLLESFNKKAQDKIKGLSR
ncbi:hypothetical protein [Helicobacter magdeburgensis]|uniref:hypothetical protein n=1 Tax=Helicobacter magdeburgensis TaxID=471858 RepID=UPI001F1E2937|nr:hypothetical protein [Helicobacter magdeburgensis]